MPDWDYTDSGESGEDAAWRELVARFDEPVLATEPAPWPEREDVPGIGDAQQSGRSPSAGAGDAPGTGPTPGADALLRDGGDAPVTGATSRKASGQTGTDRPSGPRPAGRDTGEPGRHSADRRRGPEGLHGADKLRDADGLLGPDGHRDGGGRHSADPVHGADPVRGADQVHGADQASGTGEARGTGELHGTDGTHGAYGVRGFDDEDVRGTFGADGLLDAAEPDVIQAARRDRKPSAHGTRARKIRSRRPGQPEPADDEGHFIPPAPPPLPKLDPVTKGAWAALFGGPAYLVIATAAGWSIPGIAAFCAVAAFVTGFAILVLRMNEPGPGGPDDGDDGAVV